WLAQGLGDHQLDALETVRDQTRQLISDVKESGTTDTEDPDRQLIRNRLTEVLETTEQLISAGSQPNGDMVIWATRPSQFEPGQGWVEAASQAPAMRYAPPVARADKCRDKLLHEANVILTSAPLTIGVQSDPIIRDLGFSLNGGTKVKALDVGSPFDY